jgi:hypothetical protein
MLQTIKIGNFILALPSFFYFFNLNAISAGLNLLKTTTFLN